MKKIKRFEDFVEAKDEDLKDGLAGIDYKGPLSTKPDQKATKGMNSKPLPYKNIDPDYEESGTVLVAKDDKVEKPLGDEATPGMTPKVCATDGEAPKLNTKNPKYKKLTSEQFLNVTKEMSPAEFAKFVLECYPNTGVSSITDLYGNEFTPEPNQTIEYISALLLGSEMLMERFIREIKRREGLKPIIEALLNQPESYEIFVEMLEEDDKCDQFAKSINNKYVTALDKFDFAESVDEQPSLRFGSFPKTQGSTGDANNPMGGGGGHDPRTGYEGSMMPRQGGSFGGGGPTSQQAMPQGGMPQSGQPKPQFPEPQQKQKMFMKDGSGSKLVKALSRYPHFKNMMKRMSGE